MERPDRVTVYSCMIENIMASAAFPELIAEYARESSIEGLPPPNAKMETYRHLEATGMLHSFAAVQDRELVGFITLLAPTLPHYGVLVAVCESFFVASAHRSSGAGLRLLAAAEGKAKGLGSPGLLISAPFQGKLFELLPRCGYTESSRIFFKKMANA